MRNKTLLLLLILTAVLIWFVMPATVAPSKERQADRKSRQSVDEFVFDEVNGSEVNRSENLAKSKDVKTPKQKAKR